MTGRPLRPDSKRAQAKAATRAKILSAAQALFAEHGYWGTTIRTIAAQIRMSTGAVLAHFEDKDDLFVAVLGHDRRELLLDLDRFVFDESAETNLCAMLSIIYLHYHERLPLLRAKLVMEFDYRPKLAAFYRNEEAELQGRVHAAMRGDVENGTLAQSEYLEGVIVAVHNGNLRNLLEGASLGELCDKKLRWQMETLLHPFRSEAKYGRSRLRSVV